MHHDHPVLEQNCTFRARVRLVWLDYLQIYEHTTIKCELNCSQFTLMGNLVKIRFATLLLL